MKILSKALAAVLTATFLAFTPTDGFAHQFEMGSITITKPWTRATPGPARAGAGYLIIRNAGGVSDRLIKAESNLSKRTEIHTHVMDGGVMKMTHIEEGVEIPVNGEVAFEPGGLHIMFMGLKAPFKEGQSLPVTLHFEKAGKLEMELMVRSVGAKKYDKKKMKHTH